jgi:GNAT superfamily N-acetyltransferase
VPGPPGADPAQVQIGNQEHDMSGTQTIDTTRVRRAHPGELPTLADVLTRAFTDDPVTAWLFPDERTRVEQLRRFYADIFLPRMALGRDELYTDRDRCGVASWTPPGEGATGLAESLRLLPAMAAIWGRRLPRALRTLSYMESQFPEAPHWHLPFLGVVPESQGRGIGSALMQPILDRCDRDGTPAYLEASTTRSRALYLQHGFVVLDEMRLPGGGPPLWRMWREPTVQRPAA